MPEQRNVITEGRKRIVDPQYVNNPKKHLKSVLIRLLQELFLADAPHSFNFSTQGEVGTELPTHGLRIWPAFPQRLAELPLITVSVNDICAHGYDDQSVSSSIGNKRNQPPT